MNFQDIIFIEKEFYQTGRFREKGFLNPISKFKIYVIFNIGIFKTDDSAIIFDSYKYSSSFAVEKSNNLAFHFIYEFFL